MSIAEPTPGHFTCEVEPDRERVVVRPVGELDLSTVDRVERELRELRDAGFELLALDLRALTFIDSSGLELLRAWTRRARDDGFVLELHEGSEDVMRVVDLATVREALPFVRRGRFAR